METVTVYEAKQKRNRIMGPVARYAFTLIELIVVITIMAVLAAITAPAIVPLMRNRDLRAGAAQMKAAIMRARTTAITDSVHRVPLIPIKVNDSPTQYALPGGAPDVWFDDAWPTGAVAATAATGAVQWERGGVSGLCHRNDDDTTSVAIHGFEDATSAKDIKPEDVISVWVWISDDVTGVGLAAQKGPRPLAWSVAAADIVYWGADVSGGAAGPAHGPLPQKRTWVQLAASLKDLGVVEGETIKGVNFYRASGTTGPTTRVWWDTAVIWDTYLLPANILPDPTLTTYPIEFETDGRLKATLGGFWSDRMIIVRDLGNPEPDTVDADDSEDDIGYRVWECEDPDHDGSGLDRVSGTGDDVTPGTWTYETGSGSGGSSYDIDSVPDGQMYIKVNKITGSARVCSHPGG